VPQPSTCNSKPLTTRGEQLWSLPNYEAKKISTSVAVVTKKQASLLTFDNIPVTLIILSPEENSTRVLDSRKFAEKQRNGTVVDMKFELENPWDLVSAQLLNNHHKCEFMVGMGTSKKAALRVVGEVNQLSEYPTCNLTADELRKSLSSKGIPKQLYMSLKLDAAEDVQER
jgi:hypothetical protein